MRAVIVLDDAAEDVEAGRSFYNSIEPGVGEYFTQSILADLRMAAFFAWYSQQTLRIIPNACWSISIWNLLP